MVGTALHDHPDPKQAQELHLQLLEHHDRQVSALAATCPGRTSLCRCRASHVAHRTGRRVGELARASGLTVRTLHYYEQIGLLVPSRRSDAGQRIYDESDVARLYRICPLRRMGLPLAEIGRAPEGQWAWSMSATLLA